MRQNDDDAEAFEGRVHQLTEQKLIAWRDLIAAGSAPALRELVYTAHNALSETENDSIFAQAVTDPSGAGARFSATVAKAMWDQCEESARQQADREWKHGAELRGELQVENAQWHREYEQPRR